jgi:hypothetical protein
MNPNWFGTICAAAALLAFSASYCASKKVIRKNRVLLTLLSMILSIPGASFAIYYLHIFPDMRWYFEFRSWPGIELFLIPLGIAGGLVASFLPRILLIVPLFVVAGFVIVPIAKPYAMPISITEISDTWNGHVCLQSTPSTCGAASVATILRSYGVVVKERQLAIEAHSYVGGTEAWHLARAVRKRGCEARFTFVSGFNPDIPFPAVTGVRLGSVGHFIAILSREGDQFRIGDPLIGEQVLSQNELLKRYNFTGFYMQISKDD